MEWSTRVWSGTRGVPAATSKILQKEKKWRNSTKQNTHGKIAPVFQNIYSITFTGHPKCGGQWSLPCRRHGEKAEGCGVGSAASGPGTGLPLAFSPG